MIKKLTLKNFRNFSYEEFFFSEWQNAIIWKNWKWKTNILEALALFSGINFSKIDFYNLVKNKENNFYIEIELKSWDIIAISYDKEKNTKKYLINKKNTSKQKMLEITSKVVIFSPIVMNIMYLSPSLRRDFLDEILSKTFTNYKKILSEYKKILISRNKILKNIRENKSDISEIDFWDEKFIIKATQIYNYRFWISNFLKQNSKDFTKYFDNKITNFDFKYKTKISPYSVSPKGREETTNSLNKKEKLENIQDQIKKYLEKNISRDIVLCSTSLWPHTDDFEILIDNIPLVEFASRWEVKSTIIWLKLLEIKFIEKYTNKKPVLLIDDLLSELDNIHKEILLENIKWYQTFITSIRNDYNNLDNIIEL